jgi:hypothetical protein
VVRQAHNRMWVQMAVLLRLLGGARRQAVERAGLVGVGAGGAVGREEEEDPT